ncbi:MAG: L,D-transpeptidase family protein [Nitriliruptoraceae bacterium]
MGLAPRYGPRTVVFVMIAALVLAVVPSMSSPAYGQSSDIREAQTLLNEVGYPAGPVDGLDGPQTRRGLCTWRRLEGRVAHRGPLTTFELQALRTTTELPAADDGRGITVDKTCQSVFYREDGRWQQVLAASTGWGGLPREGDYTIFRTRNGWHTSTLYPAASPNMYKTMYFSGVIAVHGSNHVPARPVSAGCVRVTPAGADYLHARIHIGDPIQVIGRY